MARIASASDKDFDGVVLQAPTPVLVDFWAPWCGPCRAMAPVVEELAGAYAGRVAVVQVNTDENPLTAAQYRVFSIPTLILFARGQGVGQRIGFQPLGELVRFLDSALKDSQAFEREVSVR